MKLQIGSGEHTTTHRRDGWMTLDPDPAAGADIVAVVPPLPDAVTGQQWDHVEMIHVIEHLYLRQARRLLVEIYEVLKPGGLLVLETVNIKECARYLLGQKEPQPGHSDGPFYHMYGFYGDQRRGNPYYQHLWGYWPESLAAECHAAGFETVKTLPAKLHWPWRDFRVEAIKNG